MARPKIPVGVKLQVWTEAAGRCMFRGCNKPLWYNELTLNSRNFGEMAHIIGASEGGPRGNENSEELAKDISNIMLLCPICHIEIDDSILKNLYSVDELHKMKKEHTNRVKRLLDQKSSATRPIILTSKIGKQNTIYSDRSIQTAILPDYPDKSSDEWYKIEIGSLDTSQSEAWKVAINKIDETIDSVDRACNNNSLSHLSVFGLAPQPLLMYLGRKLGDKMTIQVFEPRRTDNLDKKWSWSNEDGTCIEFKTSKIENGNCNDVILLLALSDHLNSDKYSGMLNSKAHIYQLTIDTPVQGFLTKKSEKASFIQSCRSFLNQIQQEVARDCRIHVLPAMPASLAIEFGRLLQPTKDPEILVYQNINGKYPEKIIQLL